MVAPVQSKKQTVSVTSPHIANLGRMLEEMELRIRNSIEGIYIQKTREVRFFAFALVSRRFLSVFLLVLTRSLPYALVRQVINGMRSTTGSLDQHVRTRQFSISDLSFVCIFVALRSTVGRDRGVAQGRHAGQGRAVQGSLSTSTTTVEHKLFSVKSISNCPSPA